MVKILIVDDHLIFRDGLKALINDVDGYKVVAEADNGIEALKQIAVLDLDLVMTDLHMPEMDVIKLTRTIREKHPNLKIVILTMDAERTYINTTNKIGAHGYVTKSTSLTKLQSVLDEVMQNKEGFRLAISDRELKNAVEKDNSELSSLTKREKEILGLIAKGLTDKEIAEKIYLSPYTVITHRKNLLSKLGLNNKVELTRFAIENGIGKIDLYD